MRHTFRRQILLLFVGLATLAISCSRSDRPTKMTLPDEIAWEAVSTNLDSTTLRTRLVECVVKSGKKWRLELHDEDGVKISVYDGQRYSSTDADRERDPLKTLEVLYETIGESHYEGTDVINGVQSSRYIYRGRTSEAQLFIDMKSSFPVRLILKANGLTVETDFYPLQRELGAENLFDGDNLKQLLKPSRIL